MARSGDLVSLCHEVARSSILWGAVVGIDAFLLLCTLLLRESLATRTRMVMYVRCSTCMAELDDYLSGEHSGGPSRDLADDESGGPHSGDI